MTNGISRLLFLLCFFFAFISIGSADVNIDDFFNEELADKMLSEFEDDNYEKGVEAFKEVIQIKLKDGQTHKDVLNAADNELKKNPDDFYARYIRFISLLHLKQYDDAAKDYEVLIQTIYR